MESFFVSVFRFLFLLFDPSHNGVPPIFVLFFPFSLEPPVLFPHIKLSFSSSLFLLAPLDQIAQGWTNFKKELKALRESVRFGAPGPRASAPKTALGMATSSAVKAVSEAAFAADVRLEAAGVLPKLEAPATKDRAVAADDDVMVTAAATAAAAAGEGKSSSDGGDSPKKITRSVAAVRSKLATLTLGDAAVWRREKAREKLPGYYKAPLPVRLLYLSLCVALDLLYAGRPIQRFWVLETVARMPYFAYISMLHLYESLGWWRAGAELRRVHFAEEWNELHHLQVRKMSFFFLSFFLCFFLSFFPFVSASFLF